MQKNPQKPKNPKPHPGTKQIVKRTLYLMRAETRRHDMDLPWERACQGAQIFHSSANVYE